MIRVSPHLHTPDELQEAIDYIKSQGISCTINVGDFHDNRFPVLLSCSNERTVWTCIAEVLDDPDEDEPTLEGHLSEYWGEEVDTISPTMGFNWQMQPKLALDKFFAI